MVQLTLLSSDVMNAFSNNDEDDPTLVRPNINDTKLSLESFQQSYNRCLPVSDLRMQTKTISVCWRLSAK